MSISVYKSVSYYKTDFHQHSSVTARFSKSGRPSSFTFGIQSCVFRTPPASIFMSRASGCTLWVSQKKFFTEIKSIGEDSSSSNGSKSTTGSNRFFDTVAKAYKWSKRIFVFIAGAFLASLLDNSSDDIIEDETANNLLIKEFEKDKNKTPVLKKIKELSQEMTLRSAKELLEFMVSSDEEIRNRTLYTILQIIEQINNGKTLGSITAKSLIEFEQHLYKQLKPPSETSPFELYLFCKIYSDLTETLLIRGKSIKGQFPSIDKCSITTHVMQLRNRVSENIPPIEIKMVRSNLNMLSFPSEETSLSYLSDITLDFFYLYQILGNMIRTSGKKSIQWTFNQRSEYKKTKSDALEHADEYKTMKSVGPLIEESKIIFSRILIRSALFFLKNNNSEWYNPHSVPLFSLIMNAL